MNRQEQSTPRPWSLDRGWIWGADDHTMVVYYTTDDDGLHGAKEGDLPLIVEAVNQYDATRELVGAARPAEESIRRMALRLDKEPGNQTAVLFWLQLADKLAAALAKVQS